MEADLMACRCGAHFHARCWGCLWRGTGTADRAKADRERVAHVCEGEQ